MNIVLMREERDCHVAAIATACQVTYEEAAKALNHVDLPGPLESPIFSNPWNLYRALIKLGFWKKNITWSMLADSQALPDETIVLVKDSQLAQHWIVWGGVQLTHDSKRLHRCFWGNSESPVYIEDKRFKEMFLSHWPNCAFQVYKANFWTLLKARVLSWFSWGF